MTDPIVEGRDRWLAASPAERAVLGPAAIATCGDALRTVASRLAALEYPVESPFEPCPDVDGAVDEARDAGVVIPPALVAVWREIGAISLVDLGRYRHVGFWDARLAEWRAAGAPGGDRGYDPCCDGVVIDGPSADGWLDYVLDCIEEQAEEDDERPPAIEIAPDDLHKDNVSGSGPYEVLLPAPGEDPWLAVIDGFRWPKTRPPSAPPDPPDVVSYLRTAVLECGGFPGLYGHPACTEVLATLTADLPVF